MIKRKSAASFVGALAALTAFGLASTSAIVAEEVPEPCDEAMCPTENNGSPFIIGWTQGTGLPGVYQMVCNYADYSQIVTGYCIIIE